MIDAVYSFIDVLVYGFGRCFAVVLCMRTEYKKTIDTLWQGTAEIISP